MNHRKDRKGSLRGPQNKFTVDEDEKLKLLVKKYGESNWEEITNQMPGRNLRQCKDRWMYYLSPNVNTAPWSNEEEQKLVRLVKEIGPHWVKIASLFDRRTDTQIKNKWNVLKRRIDQFSTGQKPLEKEEEEVNNQKIESEKVEKSDECSNKTIEEEEIVDIKMPKNSSPLPTPQIFEIPFQFDFDNFLPLNDNQFDPFDLAYGFLNM